MSSNDIRARLMQRLREKKRELEEEGARVRSGSPAEAPESASSSLFRLGGQDRNELGCFHTLRFPATCLGLDTRLLARRLRGWSPPAPGLPEDLQHRLFLDLETTGLSGRHAPLFLVGLAYWQGEDLEIVQFFARSTEEEAAVVEATRNQVLAHRGLVTFNGRSFDWPYLRHRFLHHGLEIPDLEDHLDVCLLARRQIGRRYGDCRLQTLETCLCGRSRSGDIPSALIPGAYHHYLDTGELDDIERILYHNALDLVTTAELMLYLNEQAR